MYRLRQHQISMSINSSDWPSVFSPLSRRLSFPWHSGDVMQLINSYDAKYGPVHPVFYQGTYAQALNAAKQELTFLVVYLHSDNNRFAKMTV